MGCYDVDEGNESFCVFLFVVVIIQQGLNELCYFMLFNIMKVKKKELCKDSFDIYGVQFCVCIVNVEIQICVCLNKMIDGKDLQVVVVELFNFLCNEVKVIV